MTLTLSPARLEDLGEIGSHFSKPVFKAAVVQMSRSVTLTIRDGDGRVAVIFGLLPDGNAGECWMHAAPWLKGSKLAPRVARMIIRVIEDLPGVRMVAATRTENSAGVRLMQLSGFTPTGTLFDKRAIEWERQPLTASRPA